MRNILNMHQTIRGRVIVLQKQIRLFITAILIITLFLSVTALISEAAPITAAAPISAVTVTVATATTIQDDEGALSSVLSASPNVHKMLLQTDSPYCELTNSISGDINVLKK